MGETIGGVINYKDTPKYTLEDIKKHYRSKTEAQDAPAYENKEAVRFNGDLQNAAMEARIEENRKKKPTPKPKDEKPEVYSATE